MCCGFSSRLCIAMGTRSITLGKFNFSNQSCNMNCNTHKSCWKLSRFCYRTVMSGNNVHSSYVVVMDCIKKVSRAKPAEMINLLDTMESGWFSTNKAVLFLLSVLCAARKEAWAQGAIFKSR